ncbi:hypothetical protein [Pseudomonas sp. S2.OTC.A_B10]|uniref:hypothetical protein n=1 Tax=Pseudomonas sp. S2.OTC.A_B10 TaxID=3237018 RepID=UPI003CF45A97
MNTVKVAAFRNETDRLFRLANSHYHACVGVREVKSWQGIAARALAETADLSCNRATAYDLVQWSDAVKSLKDSVAASVQRLERLQEEQTRKAQRPILRILSPSENYTQGDRIH